MTLDNTSFGANEVDVASFDANEVDVEQHVHFD